MFEPSRDVFEHKWDVFISYCHMDKELVRPLVHGLWMGGVKYFWWDDTHIAPGNSIPKEIDEGIATARYVVPVVTQHYLDRKWTRRELDSSFMADRRLIPVWLEVDASHVASRSPMLASLKAIVDSTAVHAASQILTVLSRDSATRFAADASEREEIIASWGMIFCAIKYYINEDIDSTKQLMRQMGGIRSFLAHCESSFGTSKQRVLDLSDRLDFIDPQRLAQALALSMKADVEGWAPYIEGDQALIDLLEQHGEW